MITQELPELDPNELPFIDKEQPQQELKIGDKVVRVNKSTKPKLWEILSESNVFMNNFVCHCKDELLQHFHKSELRLASSEEIQASQRIDH
ncbi:MULTISPECIES: hypothetical protein [Acinetobacter]|uniref:hypothetical protein n=1 Tax=Acinetobacter TaxID=469 RepID=UPI00066037C9|nr:MULTISPECIES: hypothetical protein [Acinetobacter]RSC23227.1 hypothetical protein EGS47_10965 [Acinetobacter sp. FDAARGOS_515]VTX85844.1 Uncharacterised protein [Acinetobacter ursingii]